MTIYSFTVPRDVLRRGSEPYDNDYHAALLSCAKKLKNNWGCECLVTGSAIFVSRLGEDRSAAAPMQFASDLTACINGIWPTKARIVFDIDVYNSYTFESIKRFIQLASKAEYELYMENYERTSEPSLFGKDFCLPYEQTPLYFREGIFVQ